MNFKISINCICLLLILLVQSCERKIPGNANILVVGHGGDGFATFRNNVPANTLAAINRGFFIEGADAVEMDLQLTKDSSIILFHNTILDGLTDCKGCVSEYSVDEIIRCHHLSKNGLAGDQFSITKLEEIIALLAPTSATLFLNVKFHDPCEQSELDSYKLRFSRALLRVIEAHDFFDRVYIETNDSIFLTQFHKFDSRFRIIYDDENFASGLAYTNLRNIEGFAISNEQVTTQQVDSAHASGRLLIIWGVKVLSGSKTAVAKNPDAIMTDDVRMLRQIVDD